jgi:hypothetical protein
MVVRRFGPSLPAQTVVGTADASSAVQTSDVGSYD